ncbi:Hypothetical_protein [Hexamita inflata]|uniref:Hypothetical_protein n=1 Tax=Hexamita inflata TaxID=28002 RepID=A0AA86QMQ8_9EUKA|nr:Hypothetical protein HINF_LOCUS44683 [Hexamita inflata]CAI9957040.1 Hypothetical protein HINF_LOCUS44685 [Hexamita inflata]CAI9957042.1 Hypothetical protein HINF_LOCUS44687 [Hexamita inflata]CAI9957044.1 Hypothetical protein HINF_LOCUS44689 [Hexamita inflata]CAI9957048.1 Hypothetical protein HINF_LOCUS44693 [Hexamita inflata]
MNRYTAKPAVNRISPPKTIKEFVQTLKSMSNTTYCIQANLDALSEKQIILSRSLFSYYSLDLYSTEIDVRCGLCEKPPLLLFLRYLLLLRRVYSSFYFMNCLQLILSDFKNDVNSY